MTAGVVKEFTTTWALRGKRTKQCRICRKRLVDGDQVEGRLLRKEKLYPVKGIMVFHTWQFRHLGCQEAAG